MTVKEKRSERWLFELSNIEFENQRLLDDDSLRLVAELRSRKLLTDEEWAAANLNFKRPSNVSAGRGMHKFQGSQGHLLDLLDRPEWCDELNSVLSSSHAVIPPNSLRVPTGSDSPEEWGLVTFCNRHCTSMMDVDRFSRWWVRDGRLPQWDLISQCQINGSPGLLIVEAKAHENELRREGKRISLDVSGSLEQVNARISATLINHGYIGRCIDEACDDLRRHIPSIAISRDRNYQLSNRIASVWKLADCGMPAVLLYLGFIGDEGMSSKGRPFGSADDWKHVMKSHFADVGAEALLDRGLQLSNGTSFHLCVGSLQVRRHSVLGGPT